MRQPGRRNRPVSPLGGGSKPLTTVTQNIYDNGIAGEITFDIGLAVVSLKLRAIRKLPEPAC